MDLRTAVLWEGLGEPVQVVWRQAQLPVETRRFDPAQGAIADQLVASCHPRKTRLDLSRAPLLRLVLAQDRERWLGLFLFHHLIMDHTTLEVVLEEIMAHLEGEGERLPPQVPFRSFVAQARGGVSPEQHEAFFRHMLGTLQTPTLPFGLVDVLGDGSRMREARHELPADLARRLRQQTRQLGVTPAGLCHLAWALVLSRCSNQDDVVFGTVLFGRLQGGEGVERALGMFINTLPLRILCGARPVAEALRETQRLLLGLLRHEHASLHLAQRSSALAVSPQTPLFSALLNYRHSPSQDDVAPAFEGIEVLQSEERSNYPFGLSVDDLGEGFALTAQVESVDPERICGFMQGALLALVRALEEAPQRPLCTLDLLPPNERQRLLVEWNATATPLPEGCVHTLFEAQVAKAPDAAAVLFEDKVLSYGELNSRANQLAHLLLELGVGPDALVAIALERSLAMIVALLATLKAGGAYVPLDPEYPPGRLAFMLEDSACRILITEQALRGRLPEMALHTLYLESAEERLTEQARTNPARTVSPRHLAYVIYTSGSTGKPKGVAVEHRGLSHLALAQIDAFGSTPDSRVLQCASFSFDASISEIMMALCAGAVLRLPTAEERRPGPPLEGLLKEAGITHLTVPPTALQALASSDLPGLKTLIVAGEPCPPSLAALWSQGRRFFNAYGPTEFTVCASLAEYTSVDPNAATLPIGRPITNTTLYILDRHQQPTPMGVAGELHLGGTGLARGYLGRPGLTAERFIAHPFCEASGGRLYKTGDLAAYRGDGTVEFLGRLDTQVKIRGFRIELGEIEAALMARPGIRDAVVMARGDGAERQLVAYVVPRKLGEVPVQPDPAALRGALKANLPDYMVPAAWVVPTTLPLTPNGKVDRAALARLDLPEAQRHGNAVPPRDAIEQGLVELWESLLAVQPIGIEDSFFEMGGHSLLAVRLVAQVDKQFGQRLPLNKLFELQTIAGIASWLRDTGTSPEASCLVKIRSRGSRPPLFMVPGAEGYVGSLYPLAQQLDPEIPFFAFQARGLDGKSPPHRSLEVMAAHYVERLLEVQPEGPYFLAGYSFGGKVVFAMAQILLARGQQIAKLIILDTTAPTLADDETAPPLGERQLIEVLFEHLFDQDQRSSLGKIEELTIEQLLDAGARRLEAEDLVPRGGGARYLGGLLRVLETSHWMASQYSPKSSQPLPIALIRPLECVDERTTETLVAKDLAAKDLAAQDSRIGEDLGWSCYSSQPLSIYHVPGNHSTMMRPPHIEVLAEHLMEFMAV